MGQSQVRRSTNDLSHVSILMGRERKDVDKLDDETKSGPVQRVRLESSILRSAPSVSLHFSNRGHDSAFSLRSDL